MILNFIYIIFLFLIPETESAGILFPQASETRDVISLDGLWDFSTDRFSQGREEKWYTKSLRAIENVDVQLMPVPSSYNEIGTSEELRDYVGPVWYETQFFVPKSWERQRVWIRFSSACRETDVWINRIFVLTHDIGHLPFQVEISDVVIYGASNRIMVSVDSTLLENTIPQGSVEILANGRSKQTYSFDFFNYGGIDRPVVVYTTPQTYIDDITVTTDVEGNDGVVSYNISVLGNDNAVTNVYLLDMEGNVLDVHQGTEGLVRAPNVNLWWPYLMDPNPGYLYNLDVQLLATNGDIVDRYVQRIGIRTLTWNNTGLYINSKPVYLRGFGRHEDSDIRGKGLDLPLVLRDHNLLKWVGANSYRTSHYPYAEEIMDLADELGIMIIDESPAVNTENFNDVLLNNHKKALTELVQRDKNRPSVIIWSAANEPRTQYEESEDYYRQVVDHLKSLDSTRPVTVVNNQLPDDDHSGQFIDIASTNIYRGWYSETGDLDTVIPLITDTVRRWNELHNIPVIVTEYGADTQEGFHTLPETAWAEEYQDQFLQQYFKAFDQLRDEGYFIGELVWNFADFRTAQTIRRVGGNKKGVFTRNRQPKSSAHLLRKRYWKLAAQLDGADPPDDIDQYTAQSSSTHDEL